MSARQDVGAVVFQALEKRTPFGVNRGRVGLVARIEVLDVVGIAAVEETGAGKCGVSVRPSHAQVLWLRAFAGSQFFAQPRSAASLSYLCCTCGMTIEKQ